MSYDTDADYLYTQEDIDRLEAELAEARAQGVALAGKWREVHEGYRKSQDELSEARAQIAAKDAALRYLLDLLPAYGFPEDILQMIRAALSAPARETT